MEAQEFLMCLSRRHKFLLTEAAGDDARSRNARDSEDVLHSLLLP